MKLPPEIRKMFQEYGRKGGSVKNKNKGFASRPENIRKGLPKKLDNIQLTNGSKPVIIKPDKREEEE